MNTAIATTGMFLGGAALGAGVTLGAQSFGPDTLARTQQGPDDFNHLSAGATGVVALIGGLAVAAKSGRPASFGAPVVTGAVAGAAAGAYLLAPSIRRLLAER